MITIDTQEFARIMGYQPGHIYYIVSQEGQFGEIKPEMDDNGQMIWSKDDVEDLVLREFREAIRHHRKRVMRLRGIE